MYGRDMSEYIYVETIIVAYCFSSSRGTDSILDMVSMTMKSEG